ncbi:MAG: hypothetical protein WCK64_03090 [Synechococcaceae cyanobacterium ELA445]
MKSWIKELAAKQFGRGTYSQSYQDELLDLIFGNIGTVNSTPFCVEFGFNSSSLTGGSGVNVASLILKDNWKSLLLDGDNECPEINLHKHYLSSSNISDIFRQYDVPKQPEYVSIDVDSTDLWLFEALLKEYRAMVFSVEYNAHYPLDAAITFPNDLNERWEGDRGYGASLKALTIVAKKYGYSLLWVVPCLDAFFVRNDLIEDGSGQICFPFSKWRHSTGVVSHVPLKNPDRAEIFLDYEVYESTNGDISKAKARAYPICKKFLLGNFFADRLLWKAKRIIQSH